jgi:signal transduction histidine kinase
MGGTTVNLPAAWEERVRDLRAAFTRDAALLPKVIASFVAVLAIASVVTLLLETRITSQQLENEAISLFADTGDLLDERITADATRTNRLMSTIAQGLFGIAPGPQLPDGPDTSALRTLSVVRLSDPRIDLIGVVDVTTGTSSRAGLPSRASFASLDPADAREVARSPGSTQRIVPLDGGGYAVAYVLPIDRLEAEPRLLVAGYAIDALALRRWARETGVQGIEVVVDGEVVATTLRGDRSAAVPEAPALRTPLTPIGDWQRVRTTQQTDDGQLVRYIAIGSDRAWDTPASIGLVAGDQLAGLGGGLARTRLLMALLLLTVGGAMAYVLAQLLTRPVLRLTETATAIAAGDLDRSFDVARRDEIGRLAVALERMRRALRAQLLVIGRQADALQEAARRIVGVQDDERQRVAQDLHDGIQQQLVVLRMQVGVARAQLADDPDQLDTVTASLATSIDNLLDQLRSTGHQLFPSILRDRGLGPALFSLASRADVPLDVTLHPDPLPRLDPEVEINGYFLLSEAVLNALKHADADRVSIRIAYEVDQLRVVAEDDGVGFEVGSTGRRGGLVHMRDRVNALRGTLQISSQPGHGTRIEALLPLPDRDGRPTGDAAYDLTVRSVTRALQVEEHGGDASVELEVLGEAQLAEDGVGVLLDGPVGDRQLPRDGGVTPSGGHE